MIRLDHHDIDRRGNIYPILEKAIRIGEGLLCSNDQNYRYHGAIGWASHFYVATVDQLKEYCRVKGLPYSSKSGRDELVERCLQSL